MIVSEIYSIPTGKYVKVLFLDIFNNYLIWILSVFVALIFITIFDIRWFFVLLMAVFIVSPMIVSYLYIWHCFKPEMRLSILSKYIQISTDGINLVFDDEKQTFLSWNQFGKCRITKDMYIFTFKKSKYLYFLIPMGAVGDFKEIVLVDIVVQED